MRRITVLLFILSLCLILSCLDFEAVRDPGTLYVHLGAEPGHLNPVTSTEAVASSINQHIYETLVDRDYDTLEIIPQLASGWKVASNHLTYTFYLKKGVYWSDGVEFTADDVVYSFKKVKDPKVANGPLKVYYIDVKNCRKLGKYTVQFEYS
ncbi:MAG TPA: ABC transporter substrate-binding protein, partial [Spirochaetota bacterium]|nr:ABC transporter substrate-binding protein [Spirochaetota bacterium]